MTNTIQVLFKKYLNDECTEAEMGELLNYFNIQTNEKLLKELILKELKVEVDEYAIDVSDVNERLNVIHSSLNDHIQKISLPHKILARISWPRIAAAAAIVIATFSGIFYLKQKHSIENLQLQVVKNHIKPGGNKAILRLANGEEINLSDVVDGQVAMQSGIKITKTSDGQLVYQVVNGKIEDGKVLYNTIEAPAGGQWQVTLPDKSHVWLNAKSSLTFPTSFKGAERRVELKGEAYFEISHNKTMPFKVVSKGQTVEVLGTHFNVMAYPDESRIKTTLMEGSVKITQRNDIEMLKPGQQAQVTDKGIQLLENVDLEEAIAWKNGYFKFNGSIEDIMSKISRWYDMSVVYESKPDSDYTFEGEISRSRNLNEVLKIMQYTGKVQFEIEGRRIIVKK